MWGKLVLGGISLAAAGYGLKKYVEHNDNCIGDSSGGFGEKSDAYEAKAQTPQSAGIERLYTSKERFYKETVPEFLACFSRLRNLPDFEMEPLYDLQQTIRRETLHPKMDDAEDEVLDDRTRESVNEYHRLFDTGVSLLEKLLEHVRESTKEREDYADLSGRERECIENSYLLAVELTGFCYSDTLDSDNHFSKALAHKTLRFRKLLDSLQGSLKNSQNSTSGI